MSADNKTCFKTQHPLLFLSVNSLYLFTLGVESYCTWSHSVTHTHAHTHTHKHAR